MLPYAWICSWQDRTCRWYWMSLAGLLAPLWLDRDHLDAGHDAHRALRVAGEHNLVAVFPGRHPGHEPLARIDAQPRALNVLVVHHKFAAALDPIAACVIGNSYDFVREMI